MALIKCKECGTEVSSKAETCPKCGARVAAKPMGCGTLIGVVFLGAIIISAFSSITGGDTASQSTASTTQAIDPTPKSLGSQWLYNLSDDAMGKGAIHQAEVSSSNTVNFDFPYSGAQRATLTLR
ncbi:MAG: zinc-ribbon domain-containing protein, partial [Methylophilaceae bacterium]